MQQTKTSKIDLYTRAPFDIAYQNVIYFKNASEMDEFFENSKLLTKAYSANSYATIRKNGHINIDAKVEDVERCVYMRFENKGVKYYAFIVDTIYINEKTTQIIFEIDVFNTKQLELFSTKFGGHVEQMTRRRYDSYGRPSTLKLIQGFNLGKKKTVFEFKIDNKINWLVFVLKPTAKLSAVDWTAEQMKVSFPCSFKGFRYFICPINKQGNRTIEYTINGKTYKSVSVRELIEKMTNQFIATEDGNIKANTANQIINIYTTKSTGIGYTYDPDNNTVSIHSNQGIKAQPLGLLKPLPIDPPDPKPDPDPDPKPDPDPDPKPDPDPDPKPDPKPIWSGDLKYNNTVMPERIVKQILRMCRQYKILPSVPAVQTYFEPGGWGKSPVAQANNNWVGMTWVGDTDVPVKKRKGQPRAEGGYYVHYESLEDCITDYMYLLRPGNLYNISGQTTYENAVKGLFKEGGAKANYAASGYTHYWSNMKPLRNQINNANNGRLDELDKLVYDGTNWIADGGNGNGNVNTDIAKGVNHLKSKLGVKVGNGECYGLVAEYAGYMGGPWLGAGTAYSPPKPVSGGDTMNAYNIGNAYDWSKEGFTVKKVNSINDLKVGDIFTWNPNVSPWTVQYGHAGVVVSLGGGKVQTLEQNGEKGRIVAEYSRSEVAGLFKDLIRPPKKQGMGAIEPNVSVLEILEIEKFRKEEIELFDIKKKVSDIFLAITSQVEPQLLTDEFVTVRMFDLYGNSYLYSLQHLPDGVNNLEVRGSICDSNKVHFNIKGYARTFGESKSNTYFNGIMDSTPRSLTVLSDNSATYMQANKNRYEAMVTTFNENKDMLEKNVEHSVRLTEVANEQATYNSNYAIESSKWALGQSVFSGVGNVAGNLMMGNVVGGVMGAVNSGFNVNNAYRGMENAKQQGEFTQTNNSMRSQSNALANMQAKQVLNQNIRSFNAGIKDIDNQPSSVQIMGNDLSFQQGYDADSMYISVEIPENFALTSANQYMRMYGVRLNNYVSDIRSVVRQRKDYNYIKTTTLDAINVSMNSTHLLALKSIFATGVRIWNYKENLDKLFLNYNAENEDQLV